MAQRMSSLDLVRHVDAFPNPETDLEAHDEALSALYTLVWDDGDGPYPIGYMRQWVFDALMQTPADLTGTVDVDPAARTISLFRQVATEPERTSAVSRLTAYWRANKTFLLLSGWRNELWPVYGRNGDLLFSMERSALGLFGAARYGVHMTAFVYRHDEAESKFDFRIWVPKRSPTKTTYPGMLDNTVAGGMMTNEDPFECIIREADEEASLPESLMRQRVVETGTITYVYITEARFGGDPGYIYPECQWVYDLELPDDGSVVPEPKDGEVESFTLQTVEEIQEQLARGLWKPNSAVVVIDFFMRHGVYTPENEPDFPELYARAHRDIPFPGPHKSYRLPTEEEIEQRRARVPHP
ncbi:NUDIX hydrolase domain-like protein [Schizothecium vesticola]|uniref:NUDIX hydrolase domain-like protein n=1 Tax=Schizothecium vesticola TaxID=314040 RepID=A0AA40K9U2_9PEZI|nr:NUDIX hydrolase domain-like protein [Schizothecium vesticola]